MKSWTRSCRCRRRSLNRGRCRREIRSADHGPRSCEAPMAEKKERPRKIGGANPRAGFNLEVGEAFGGGIPVTGREVKSLPQGRATIAESYADTRGGEVWL